MNFVMESPWEIPASTGSCLPWISTSFSPPRSHENKKQSVVNTTNCLNFKSITCLSLLSRLGRLFTFVKMHKNMFIKGFQDKFKVKSGLKFLKGEMERTPVRIDREKGITNVGCIVDVDSFGSPEVFYELIEEFSLRPNAIKIVGYKREHDKNSPYSIQMFTDRDLGWKGQIHNGYVLEFLGRQYDLLSNYYQEDTLMMKLLSVR